MNLRRWHIPTTMVFLILGIILSTQFKAQQNKIKVENNELRRSSDRIAAMEKILNARNQRQKELNQEVEGLKSNIESYEKLASEKHQVIDGISKEIDKFRIITGTTKVKGSGIIITIDEPKDGGADTTPIIFQEDLIDILNILKYAGAEAIAVNGQRIVSFTSVYQGGDNLLINNIPINKTTSPNYEIVAIGPKNLADRVASTSGIIDELKSYGANIKINNQENLVIPSFAGRTFRYAKPAIGR